MLQFPNLPTPEIVAEKFAKQLQKIEMLAQVLEHLPLSHQIRNHVFHQQLLKSALFSARIEGNSLTLVKAKDLDFSSPKSKEKQEISNVLQAINTARSIKTLSEKSLRFIHQKVMYKLDADAGKFRAQGSAIFDQFGNIVYLTPTPEEMKEMLAIWLKQAQVSTATTASITAALTTSWPKNWQATLIRIACCHYYFEKIHPFLDGNGRTGRVALQWQLQKLRLFGDFTLPIDQFFDEKRNLYYNFLEKNSRQQDQFVAFFLEGITWSLEKLLEDIKNFEQNASDENMSDEGKNSANQAETALTNLLPRRTLAYDLQQLVKAKLIIKQGETRGVVYTKRESAF